MTQIDTMDYFTTDRCTILSKIFHYSPKKGLLEAFGIWVSGSHDVFSWATGPIRKRSQQPHPPTAERKLSKSERIKEC